MEASRMLRQLPRTRTTLLSHTRTRTALIPSPPTCIHARAQTRQLSVPTILRPSFWATMIPKPLRSQDTTDSPQAPQRPSRTWNPATPYIILSLLVGSQAIQVLWLKQERAQSSRKAEMKIGILKEVIERVQRGEKVDVEGVLGTGDAESEKAWAEVLKEVKDEESLFKGKKRKALAKQAAEHEAETARLAGDEHREQEARIKVESLGGVKFY